MTLVLGQRSVGTTATFVCTAPAGSYSLVLTGGTVSVFIGAVATGTSGTSVTVANGAPLPASIAISYTGFPGSAAQDIYAVTAAVTTTVGYHLCTDR